MPKDPHLIKKKKTGKKNALNQEERWTQGKHRASPERVTIYLLNSNLITGEGKKDVF